MSRSKPVGIGLVGMGFMGLTHLRGSRNLRGGRVVAMVTTDPRKARGDFSRVRGNFGSGGAREDLTDIQVYSKLDRLLEDERVTLVDICLPSHLHAEAAVESLRRGKAVLVEKPVALKIADTRRMLAASRRARKQLLVAQVLKFFPEFALLGEAIQKGRWGPLRALNLRRVIAKPSWGDKSWFGDPRRSGGMVVDLHIHDTDFVVHLFGRPRAVTSHGLVEDGQVHSIRTVYHHRKNGPLVSSEAGWINAPALIFEHGYDAFFERATLHYNSSHAPRPRLYTKSSTKELSVPEADAFGTEIQAAVDSVRREKTHPLLDAKAATASLAVCLAEERSAKSGKKVTL